MSPAHCCQELLWTTSGGLWAVCFEWVGCITAGITEFLLCQPSHVSLGQVLVCRGHAASSALVTCAVTPCSASLGAHRQSQSLGWKLCGGVATSAVHAVAAGNVWDRCSFAICTHASDTAGALGSNGVSWWESQFSTSQEPHVEQTGPGECPDTDKTTAFPSLSNQSIETCYQEKFSSPDENRLLNFPTLVGKSLLTHVGRLNISVILFMACTLVSVTLYKISWFLIFFVLGWKTTARNCIKEESMTCTLIHTHLCFYFQNRQEER